MTTAVDTTPTMPITARTMSELVQLIIRFNNYFTSKFRGFLDNLLSLFTSSAVDCLLVEAREFR